VRRIGDDDGKNALGLRIDKNSSRASEGRLDLGEDLGDVTSFSEEGEWTMAVALLSSNSMSSLILARSRRSVTADTNLKGVVERLAYMAAPSEAIRTGRGATRIGMFSDIRKDIVDVWYWAVQ